MNILNLILFATSACAAWPFVVGPRQPYAIDSLLFIRAGEANTSTSLTPVPWQSVVNNETDPFAAYLLGRTNVSSFSPLGFVNLSMPGYAANFACVNNKTLTITFGSEAEVEQAADDWTNVNGSWAIVTPTSGCSKTANRSEFWLVQNSSSVSRGLGLNIDLSVESLTPPGVANCSSAYNGTYLGFPTAACGSNFDTILDGRIGPYGFTTNLTNDIFAFAPGLRNATGFSNLLAARKDVFGRQVAVAALNPALLARALTNSTVQAALPLLANLTAFAQSIQAEAIYVPSVVAGLVLLDVPFAPPTASSLIPMPPPPSIIPSDAPPVLSSPALASIPVQSLSPDASIGPGPQPPVLSMPLAPSQTTLPVTSVLSVPTASPSPPKPPVSLPVASSPSTSAVGPPSSPLTTIVSPASTSSPPSTTVSPPGTQSQSSSFTTAGQSSSNLSSNTVTTGPTSSSVISMTVTSSTTSALLPRCDYNYSDPIFVYARCVGGVLPGPTDSDRCILTATDSSGVSSYNCPRTTGCTYSTDTGFTTAICSGSVIPVVTNATCTFTRTDDAGRRVYRCDPIISQCTYDPVTTSDSEGYTRYILDVTCPSGIRPTAPGNFPCQIGSRPNKYVCATSECLITGMDDICIPGYTVVRRNSDGVIVEYCAFIGQDTFTPANGVYRCRPQTPVSSSLSSQSTSSTSSGSTGSSSTGSISSTSSGSAGASSSIVSPLASSSISASMSSSSTSSAPISSTSSSSAAPSSSSSSSSSAPPIPRRVRRQSISDALGQLGNTVTRISRTTLNEASQTLGIVGSEEGNLAFASQTVANQLPWIGYDDVIGSDSLDRFMHYYPDLMEAFGVSRLRVANISQLPRGSSAISFVPIDVSTTQGSQSRRQAPNSRRDPVYVPLNSNGQAYYPIICQIATSATTKMFLARSPTQGIAALMNPALRKVLTGGVVSNCGIVSFESDQIQGYGTSNVGSRQ